MLYLAFFLPVFWPRYEKTQVMQQRAAVPTHNRFEPLLTSFAEVLCAFQPATSLPVFTDDMVRDAQRRCQQSLDSQAEGMPTAAVRFRAAVWGALGVWRAAKKQRKEPAIVWVEMTAAALPQAVEPAQFAALQKIIMQLPEQQRRPVALSLLGLTPVDISQLLGWSAAKVQRQYERGWQRVQAKLAEARVAVTEEAELGMIYQSQPTRAELNRADCLADEFLVRVSDGDVSEAERMFVADHLAGCQDCAQEFQLVRALQAWSTQTPAAPPPKETPPAVAETPAAIPAAIPPPAVATVKATDDFPIRLVEEPAEGAAAEEVPRWWQTLVPWFVHHTGFNLFTAAVTSLFVVLSLALATWLVALHFKHKAELARLRQKEIALVARAGTEPATPESLQVRVEEAQKQLSDIQTQLTEQNADKVLSNQELLAIQNDTLQKELEDLSKPQLDAPVAEIDLAALRTTAEPGKEIVTTIDVPYTSAVFTVILHKPADKNAANYLLELFDARKPKAIWSSPKKLENQTKIALTLAKRNYPDGKYRITLSGVEGKKKELLETYHLEVKYQPLPKPKKKK